MVNAFHPDMVQVMDPRTTPGQPVLTNVHIHFTPFNWAKARSIRGSLMKMRAFLLID